MDREQIKALDSNQTIYHASVKNADGSALRARVSGGMKEWKTKPEEWYRPFKHGLRESFRIGSPNETFATQWRFSNPANWLENDPT
jgi:hypothetical protein